MIFNVTGSGGTALNFKVIGGESAPPNPTNNTIWVNTSADITSWEFSSVQPSSPTNGMVWITTGTASTAAFNALKKNSVMVYPQSAKQYIDGAWVEKEARTYQGGTWNEWRLYLYKHGQEYADITGGWVSVQAQGGYPMGNAVRGTDYLLADSNWVDNVGGTSVGWTFNNPIDVTNYKTLKFVVTTNQALNSRVSLYTGTSYVSTGTAFVDCPHGTEKEFSLDISNVSGSYKVCLSTWSGTDMKIHKVWIE